ncbi:MAG TPA: helix-turn-helix domain-containing protein [Terriglobia bacterium]|nr:helix-turn-helix domain-containing protein [Terriglobia bacterium]
MFTEKVKPETSPADAAPSVPRKRGRPPGVTEQGQDARQRLYRTAIDLIRRRGYEATTMRDVAKAAGVSAGLLYRYFPSKRAVVLELYETLSDEYAGRAAAMRAGKWRDRFLFALETSLDVLAPHRNTLRALTSTLIGDESEGVFAPGATPCRIRVERVFHLAVAEASDAPHASVVAPLGRILYLAHMAVILWWLLDRSPKQRATTALLALMRGAIPSFALALRLGPTRSLVRSFDALFREALFDDWKEEG